MSFTEQLPEWNETGAEPPQSKKDSGWQPDEKPPADWFNWLFHRVFKALQELTVKAETITGAQAKIDAHEAKAAPHSGHETPAGAQAKANSAQAAAITTAASYADQVKREIEVSISMGGMM